MKLLAFTVALLAGSVLGQDVLLLEDFADGDLKSPKHGRWSIEYDPAPGGTSTGRVDAVDDGEEQVGQLTYSVSGGIGANIYMGLPVRMDVSAYEGVRFRFRTEHTSRVTFMLVTGSGGSRVCWWAHRRAPAGWHETVVRWEELIESRNAQESPVLTAVSVLAIGSKTQPAEPEAFVLVDDLCLVRGEAAIATPDAKQPRADHPSEPGEPGATSRPRQAAPTVVRHFESIEFRCPEGDWLWDAESGTLDILTLSTQVRLRSQEGEQDAAKLRARFEQKMKLVGMQHLLVSELEPLEVDGAKASLFTATCVPPALLTRKDPELADGAHYEVAILFLAGHTYQVECRLPLARKVELVPQLQAMMKSIRIRE